MLIKRYTVQCKECGYDPNDHYFEGIDSNLYKSRKKDVVMANEYCEDEESLNSNHKMKPIWKKCCGSLNYYLVTIKNPKKDYPSYQTSR